MNGVSYLVNVKPVRLGKNVRMSSSKINEVLDMPNLIEVQKDSYKWFLEEGLQEVFRDVSAITDYSGNLFWTSLIIISRISPNIPSRNAKSVT